MLSIQLFESEYMNYLLVIWKWVTADSPVEETWVIRVFYEWTEIENPKVIGMSVLKELPSIFPAIAVKAFHTRGWVAHDNDLVGEVY